MASKKYKKIKDFPGYEVNSQGSVQFNGCQVESFHNGKFVTLRRDGINFVKKISELIPKSSPKTHADSEPSK